MEKKLTTPAEAAKVLIRHVVTVPRRICAPLAAVLAVVAVLLLAEHLQPTDPWMRQMNGQFLTWAISCAGLAVVVALVYTAGTYLVRTESLRPAQREPFPYDVDEIRGFADRIYQDIGASRAVYFARMISQPSEVIERISETLDARVSTTSIRSTYTVEVLHATELDALERRSAPRSWWKRDSAPHLAAEPIQMVFPLYLQPKGKLENSLRFFGNGGERISSLTQVSAVGYTAAVIRFLMSFAENEDVFARYRDEVEAKVIHILAASDLSMESESTLVDDVMLELWDLTRADPILSDVGQLIITLLVACSTQFPVCVVYPYGSSEHEILGHRLRFTVERDTTPGKSATPELKRIWYHRVQESLRLNLGILPTRFAFALENADRCGSYHLQIEGPKGTYLGRQAFIDLQSGEPADPPSNQYVMLGRSGQSMSHLYVRRGLGFARFQFMNLFYETPPGSLAAATLSSWAATALILMSLLRPSGDQNTTDMVAALFAVPAILAVWAGFEREPGGVGERLIVKIIRFVSIGLSVAAAFLYVTRGFPQLSEHFQWTVLSLAAAINAVCASSTWILRTSIYRKISAGAS